MQQVLFWIPIKLGWFPHGIPIYGFGAMLFIAFFACILLLSRWAKREGFSPDRIYDLALWVFGFGVFGARIVYMIQYKVPWQNFFKIWEGGIVFYGSAIGGWIGYALGWLYYSRVKKERIPTWRMADIVAPAVCVGLLIGRIGCFLNGCCYGHICTDNATCVTFPMMTAPARELVVAQGYQTMAGFTLDSRAFDAAHRERPPALVGTVEPGSPASQAGLKSGDIITQINEFPIQSYHDLWRVLEPGSWPRGVQEVKLKVQRGAEEMDLKPFIPRTLPLHPTQVYESISMFLLLLVLLAFYPFRRHYGQSFVVLMIGYAVHRFFNETLRNDTAPVLLNLTLSQVGSILVLLAAIGLEIYLRRFSERVPPTAAWSNSSVAPLPAKA